MFGGTGAIALAGKTSSAFDSNPVQFRQSCVIHLTRGLGLPQPFRLRRRIAVAAAPGGSLDNVFCDEHVVRFRRHRDDRAPESHIGMEGMLPLVVSLLFVGRFDCRRREHH